MLLLSNRIRCAGLLGVFGLLVSSSFAGGPHGAAKVKQLSTASAQKKLNEASAKFIENSGQWPEKALFLARSQNLNVWLTHKGVTFDYFKDKVGKKDSSYKGQVITMSFKGGSALTPVGTGSLGFKTQYLKASGKVQHNAGNFSGVVAKNVYPGVDLHSYYDHQKPRYDLVVNANANPNVIRLNFHGADKAVVSGNTIQLSTQIGTLSQGQLFAYQNVGGKKQRVAADFVDFGKGDFGFKLGAYDHSKQLVVDPLVYGSYYGGDGGFDSVNSITTDNAGGVYMTGYTLAPDFPSIDGPYGFTIHGGKDAFVAKLQGDAFNQDYSAYIGGSLDDNAQFISVDPFGDIWIAGRTQSSDFPGNENYQRPNVQYLTPSGLGTPNFPPTGGTFQLSYGGGAPSAAIPFNATPLEVQSVINSIIPNTGAQVTSVPSPQNPSGTLLSQGASYRIALPWNDPLLLTVTNNLEGTTYVLSVRVPGQAVEIAPLNGTNPTGGTYSISFILNDAAVFTTNPIPFGAKAAAVEAACNLALNAPTKDPFVKVQSEVPGGGPAPWVLSFVGQANPFTNLPPTVAVNNGGLTGGTFVTNQVARFALAWNQLTSAPTGGTFVMGIFIPTFNPNAVQLNYNATAAQVQAGMQAIVGANNCLTDVEPNNGTDTSLPDVTILITFCGKLANTGIEMFINNGLFPQPALQIATKTTDIFVMRFKQSSTTVLDPLFGGTETMTFFGGDFGESLAGFSILPEANPAPTDPVKFAFGGSLTSPTPEVPGTLTGSQSGYITKYTYSNTSSTFTIDPLITRYVNGGDSIDLNGVAMDRQGSVYTGGTIHFQGNADTSQSPGSSVFTTTPGVFTNGRLLRNDDMFIQKYTADGKLAYSALVGGNDFDEAGGLDQDNDGTIFNAGSTIAVDSNLDLYITGVSGSFNFPRTRGVYGEVFNNNANVTVTKVNTDASQILYSTNLQTSGFVNPAGIAVDLRGDAFITGNVHPDWVNFPDSLTQNPLNAGNPNEPNDQPLGTIQTTPDALVPGNLQPTQSGDLATVKGFLNILDPAADTLMYGTYLGGVLDDRVFGPYVDSFGDVWVYGWVDVFRQYVLLNSSGSPTFFTDYGPLPAAMISPLAFKNNPDAHGNTLVNGILYGLLSTSVGAGYIPWDFTPTTTNPGSPLGTISVIYRMDGWLDKLRVGLASVQSVTLSPSTVPGGLGASTTGTVTLSQAAPNGGADIVLTLLNNTTAASFASGSPSSTLVITIAAGATTGTFTVYTNAVTSNTPVQVQATYQGTFQIGLFTVTPWLQQLSLTPTSVVGGNSVTGRITLATVPPTGSGGVNVTVLTDSPTLVTFPGGATVNVPEGQTSVTFQIATNGVGVITYPQITASLLGVGVTQTLTLELAGLSTLSFAPASVAGGTPSTATLTLNGQATGPFIVDLTSANPAFTFADSKTGAPITTITFNTGDSVKTFTVLTPYEAASTQDVVTATVLPQGNYPLQNLSATLFVTAADITGLTVSPSEVAGGASSQGTIVINSAAPTGGVVVNLSTSNTAVAQVPATVTIPAGATSAVFTITTSVIASQSSVTIIATRGAVQETAPLTVDGVTFGLSLSPQSIVGGSTGTGSAGGTSTGTITLTSAAPANGLTFDISLPAIYDQYAFFGSQGTFTTTAFVPGLSTTGTFTINTAIVPSKQEIPITAFVHGQTTGGQSATLEVRVAGVTSISFSPSTIRGRGAQVTFCTIKLDSPAPAGGITISLSQSTPLLNLGTGTFTIPAGSTSLRIPTGFSAVGVSRSLSTVVTATPSTGGAGASAIVVVTR